MIGADGIHSVVGDAILPEGRLEDLAAEFAGWAEPVRQLIAAATETKRYASLTASP